MFVSIKTALKELRGNNALADTTIAIKGLGNVGNDLAQMLAREGAVVVGADISGEQVAKAKTVVPSMTIVSTEGSIPSTQTCTHPVLWVMS